MKYATKIVGVLSSIFLISCTHMVSYYDALSYKNLTDLKGELKVFFNECSSEGAKGDDAISYIDGFVLSANKAYEYEKGKDLNDDTIAQLKIIETNIAEVKSRYSQRVFVNDECRTLNANETSNEKTGCLTQGYCKGKWLGLEKAFDIAISTEKLKLEESDWGF